MSTSKVLTIRPYARLLTMLGEQLIKNERIALVELIKNAYDADASWVKVSFIDFDDNFEAGPNSKIIIEDNGQGMTSEIIEKHWLNPATPEKKRRKQNKMTTRKGRVIQGEKGIGRFAILKLGRKIEIVSRYEGEDKESVVHYDFSKYDDEFLSENGTEKDLYIDDLKVSLETRNPVVIKEEKIRIGVRQELRAPKGTRIKISDLKGSWSKKKIEDVYHDLSRFESIFIDKLDKFIPSKSENDFNIYIFKENELQPYNQDYIEKLNLLLENKAVISVEEGIYDEVNEEFRFLLNKKPVTLNLRDPQLTGLNVYKPRFGEGGKVLDKRKTECGSFNFGFYLFDFTTQAPDKNKLDKADKDIIRQNRVYLYRDGIRVYPYGEPDDDWLHIDMDRGTISAGLFLSNNQVVGYVNISQSGNQNLKDKTNREGLIEEGNATDDFIALLRIFLAYLRQKPYARYRLGLDNAKTQDVFRTEQVSKGFSQIKDAVKDDKKVLDLITSAERQYQTERKYLVKRAETTEELAGVGLSVETASHDIMAIMGKAMNVIDSLIKDTLLDNWLDREQLNKELQTLRGMLSFMESQLKDIQLLFKSSKQRRKLIRIKEIIEKVKRIYERVLKKEHIQLVINEVGSPLVAKTTDAVLLQLFLNLFDNSVYWLQQIAIKNKKIEITLDGNRGVLIFSDNGPGINKEDSPYIFEPFYSGKGEEGRGLGLYIARQLLERHEYAIELAELKSDFILSGANFVVSFVSEEK